MTDRTTMELVADCEIVIKRTFDAPARHVWKVYTEPTLVRKWWAPASRGVTMAVCEADVTVGGTYRYVMQRGTTQMAFSGTYTEVTPPSRLSFTQVFEPMKAAGEVTITVTFEERDGRTYLESHERYPSRQVRDAVLATGMEDGMRESMNQLAEVVASQL